RPSAVHTPALRSSDLPLSQVSVCVQALPSLQAVPSPLAGSEHAPVAGLQVPALWHWSEAVQTTGLLPVHTPLSQVSVWVQASPSLQAVPSALGGSEQLPVLGSEQLAAAQWWSGSEARRVVPVHTPLLQVSVWVQG